MMYRSSFSQHDMFEACPRFWYYTKVLKIPTDDDMSFADAGNAVHHTLEKHYNKEITELSKLKDYFKNEWRSYKLQESFLADKITEYWLMVINGKNLNLKITHCEMKLYFNDLLSFLDIVNVEDDEIADWKTSKRDDAHDKQYRKQGLLYAFAYHRKYGKIPKKVTFYYLRFTGSKGVYDIYPTEDDIEETRIWYYDILMKMNELIRIKQLPEKVDVCHPYCKYPNVCNTVDSNTKVFTIINIGQYIKLNGPISEKLQTQINRKFSYELKNSFWIKKAKPFADGIVKFWIPTKRLLPIGFKKGLIKTLTDYCKFNNYELELKEEDLRTFNNEKITMPDKFLNNRILRDYQTNAVEAFLNNKISVLEIGTGGGKTEIAIESIRRLNCKTLFIVDKIELLKQTKKRIEDSLGITVGQIGGGEDDTSQFVTAATIQTLQKQPEKYKEFLSSIRFAVFDECHKVSATSYVKIAYHLPNTEYRMGISGTNFRDDGNDMKITSVVGYKAYDLSSKKLIENGWLVKPNVIFIKNYMTRENINEIERLCSTGLINEEKKYNIYYSNMIHLNEHRNNVIQKLVDENKGKKILILTRLVDHGNLLANMLNGQHLYGGTNKDDRQTIFNDFVSGKNNILVSTLSIFAEGIDIPSLDVVINAGANKGSVKTIQVLGRVLRKLEGKENATYIDFIDNIDFLRSASWARQKTLMNEGHNVQVIEWLKQEKGESKK